MKTNSPSHDQITQRAHEIWKGRGRPTGQDMEIWLEAERQLSTPTASNDTASSANGRGNGTTQAGKTSADSKPSDLKKPNRKAAAGEVKGSPAQTERLRGEMASESEVEFQITPAIPDDDAIKAALQKREARSPQRPKKNAPHAKPTESGKPLWDKPHSS